MAENVISDSAGSPQYIFHRFFKKRQHDYAHVCDVRGLAVEDFDESRLYKVKDGDGIYLRSHILEFGSK